MTDAPKLNAYIVALAFADGGPLYVNAMLAPNDAIAAAGITTEFFQKEGGGSDKALIGVSVGQLTPEFLRIALRAYEGGLGPGKPNIVSLVSQHPSSIPDEITSRLQEQAPQSQRAAELLNRSDEPHRDAGWSWVPPVPDGAA